MTIKESANGEKCDIKPLIYTNPVPSFIGNDEIFQYRNSNLYVTKNGKIFRKRKKSFEEETPKRDRDGYCRVSVTEPYRGSRAVHSIMMEIFYGVCDEGYVVDHINSIRNDNRLENLRYVTASYNVRRGRIGLKAPLAKTIESHYKGINKSFSSIDTFLNFYSIDRRLWDLWIDGKSKSSRSRYVLLSMFETETGYDVSFDDFKIIIKLNGNEKSFQTKTQAMKYLGLSLDYFSRYFVKERLFSNYRKISYKEGLTTIEIELETI